MGRPPLPLSLGLYCNAVHTLRSTIAALGWHLSLFILGVVSVGFNQYNQSSRLLDV